MQFNSGNMLTRIILVNVAVFVLMVFLNLALGVLVDYQTPSPTFRKSILPWLALNEDAFWNLTHPWVFITSMFLHIGFFHILWNMLLLYWFGRIVGDLLGDRRVLPLYLMCGLAGGLVYFLSANLNLPFTIGNMALGASAAVLGILTAAGVTAPDYQIRLLFLGTVRLKYIVAAAVVLDLIALSSNSNSGGSLAHLGGAFMGYLTVVQMKNGNDWTVTVNRWLDWIGNLFRKDEPATPRRKPTAKARRTKMTVSHRGKSAPSDTPDHEERLNEILDKIRSEGMGSLSEEEKEFLLNASKDN